MLKRPPTPHEGYVKRVLKKAWKRGDLSYPSYEMWFAGRWWTNLSEEGIDVLLDQSSDGARASSYSHGKSDCEEKHLVVKSHHCQVHDHVDVYCLNCNLCLSINRLPTSIAWGTEE